MRKRLAGATACGISVTVALTACSGASNDGSGGGSNGEAASLEGETIELVVPFSPGGGYDTYARQLAPALADELAATVTVVNSPGAGGLQATNQLFVSEGDGHTIAILNAVGVLGSALADAEGVEYEPQDFSYIGRLTQEPNVVVARADGPLESMDDVLQHEGSALRFGAGGPGSLEYTDAVFLNEVLDLNSEVVSGYDGSSEVQLAMLSGDVDLHSLSLGSQRPVIDSGDARPLLLVGEQDVEGLDDVPKIVDLVEGEENTELVNNHLVLLQSGRLIAGPPDMDSDVLQELRDAFETVVTDDEYAAAAEESGRPIDFASGEELEGIVTDVMNASERYVEVLRQAYGS